MKFFVDMPVTPQAVAHLEARGHDAIHASAVRLLALLKLDRPGVILFRGGSYSDAEMLTLLDRVLAQSGTVDVESSITVVDQHRIRHRRIPFAD